MAQTSRIGEMEAAVKAPAVMQRTEAANPAAAALEAHARASIESRYIMAMRRPRAWDKVRQDILHECARPSFARDKSALYKKPIGQGVEGLGIRFVEMAMRCMTNMMNECRVIYEDDYRRVVFVACTDLESNVTWPREITVTKTVERSKPLDDGSYLSMRMNSYGKPVYTVQATDEDLLNKEAALISKAVRMVGLRHIPGDIQDEAEEKIRAVRKDAAAKDPDAERREIVDGFGKLNVPADELIEYVGHPLEQCSPAELVELRAVWGTIRDGEATWAQVLANHREQRPTPKPKPRDADPNAPKTSDPNMPAGSTPIPTDTEKRRGVEAAESRVRGTPAPKREPERVAEDEGGTRLFNVKGEVTEGELIACGDRNFMVVRFDTRKIVVRPQ